PLLGALFPRVRNELFEAAEVELALLDPEEVAGRLRQEDVLRKHLSQLDDKVLERGRRCLRPLLAPELLDDPIARKHLARVDQQEREQRTLLLAAEQDRAGLVDGFERPEDPELDHRRFVAPRASTEQAPLARRWRAVRARLGPSRTVAAWL